LVRDAIAMIELVIAIVIMAITLMSVPLIQQQTSRTQTFSLTQEGVMAASLKLRHILSYPFDESNARALNDPTDGNEDVLNVNNTDPNDNNLNRQGTSDFRAGHYDAPKRRKFYTATSPYADATPVNSHTKETPEDDISDFRDKVLPDILHKTAGGENSYFLSYNVRSDVAYVQYFDGVNALNIDPSSEHNDNLDTTNTSHIKFITVTVRDTQNVAGTITMSAFACNIGSEKTLTLEDLP